MLNFELMLMWESCSLFLNDVLSLSPWRGNEGEAKCGRDTVNYFDNVPLLLARNFGMEKEDEVPRFSLRRELHLNRDTPRLIPAAGIKRAAIAVIFIAVLTRYLEYAHVCLS